MQGPPDPSEQSAWPYSSLLLFGFFGVGTPAGRQLAWRSAGGCTLFVLAMAGLTVVDEPALRFLSALAMPTGVGLIGWAYQRYLRTLDELSRLMQLQAFAFAYGTVMVLFFSNLAVTVALRQPGLSVVGSVVLLTLAEPARGVCLAYLARQYR